MKKLNSSIISVSQSSKRSKFFNGLWRVKASSGWINFCKKLLIVIRGKVTAPQIRSIVVLVRKFHKVYRDQGARGLCIRTKSLYVLTQQAAAGMKISATQDLGPAVSRSKSGLPREIPVIHRQAIRKGDLLILRFYLTLFSIYRVLEFPGTLKLNTITDPGIDVSPMVREWSSTIVGMSTWLGYGDKSSLTKDLPSLEYTALNKSSASLMGVKHATLSTSVLGIVLGALALNSNPLVVSAWKRWVTLISDQKTAFGGANWIELTTAKHSMLAWFERIVVDGPRVLSPILSDSHWKMAIGKLGFKSEAAGKVRVFAMVDCWTQWALAPLHKAIFTKILSQFETDGTFDQMLPLDRLLDLGHTKFWCFDLSAATDRLPVSLQKSILSHLLSEELADCWATILIGRDYFLPTLIDDKIKVKGKLPQSVRYAVGQPMGALSSWAMLALTHHFIVALAAKRAGYQYGLFWDYAVLGDDIVIANGKVAREYLRVLREAGVNVGLAKSLVNRKGFVEFAKRYRTREQDCSPVPFVELWTALVSATALQEFVRKYNLSMVQVASIMGFGFRVKSRLTSQLVNRPKRLYVFSKWYYSPWGPRPLSLFNWFSISQMMPVGDVLNVVDTEMYIKLPGIVDKYLVQVGAKVLARVDALRQKIGGFTQTYKENSCSMISDLLWDFSSVLDSGALAGHMYNIYVEVFDQQIYRLRKDLSKLESLARDLQREGKYHTKLDDYFKSASVLGQVGLPQNPNVSRDVGMNPNGLRHADFWMKVHNLSVTHVRGEGWIMLKG